MILTDSIPNGKANNKLYRSTDISVLRPTKQGDFMDKTIISNRKRLCKELKQSIPLTLLALPAVIAIFIFNYIPLYGLVLPFKDFNVVDGIINSPWCGLKNFEFLVKSDTIIKAIRNTVLYNGAFIVLGMIMSIIIALLLYELGRRAVKVYQTMLLIPYFVSWVVVAYVFNVLLDMENGLFNTILNKFGY